MINQLPPRERLRERAPRLKWIQTTGAGLDAILPLDWLPPGITLTNNRGAHGEKAEDSCTMALLVIHTRLAEMMANQRNHVWKQILSAPIAGLTAVIIGFGDLGQGAGRAASKLGLRVIAVTRSGKAGPPADEARSVAELDAVLPLADFVVITHAAHRRDARPPRPTSASRCSNAAPASSTSAARPSSITKRCA